jgi:hypothetical protein
MGDAEMRRIVADPRAPAFESSAVTSPPALNEAGPSRCWHFREVFQV